MPVRKLICSRAISKEYMYLPKEFSFSTDLQSRQHSHGSQTTHIKSSYPPQLKLVSHSFHETTTEAKKPLRQQKISTTTGCNLLGAEVELASNFWTVTRSFNGQLKWPTPQNQWLLQALILIATDTELRFIASANLDTSQALAWPAVSSYGTKTEELQFATCGSYWVPRVHAMLTQMMLSQKQIKKNCEQQSSVLLDRSNTDTNIDMRSIMLRRLWQLTDSPEGHLLWI